VAVLLGGQLGSEGFVLPGDDDNDRAGQAHPRTIAFQHAKETIVVALRSVDTDLEDAAHVAVHGFLTFRRR
jgi:hypothetical protein